MSNAQCERDKQAEREREKESERDTWEERKAYAANARTRVALLTHSLQRNGANKFCTFLLENLHSSHEFTVFSPADGPMRVDFEALGCPVTFVDTSRERGIVEFLGELSSREFGVLIANTVMQCAVVNMAERARIPTIWVIHESWPQNQLTYYAQEVFCKQHVSSTTIKAAFRIARCIVFPSKKQAEIYRGLYKDASVVHTIHNGIPLNEIDNYRSSHSRDVVRAQLGYGSEDCVIAQVGTICQRKGQMYTAKACGQLMAEHPNYNLKVVMVGARYIRDHEIEYIDRVKGVITDTGRTWSRWEDTEEVERERGNTTSDFVIADIQSNVLPFFFAADLVVVPSINEVLPIVICEAMSFERPVVCSRVDAIPEGVDHGVEGLLVEPADTTQLREAIRRLVAQPQQRLQMGRAGRRRVEHMFSHRVMCSHYRRLIDRQMQTRTRTRTRVVSAAPLPSPVPSGSARRSLRVLVDLDNTIADWDGEFINRYGNATGDHDAVRATVRNRTHFEIENNFRVADRPHVLEVIRSGGFFEYLEPLPGAIEALHAMLADGIDVRVVTSLHPTCAAECAKEKIAWVQRHLGSEWVDRLVMTRDKTIVDGDVIIDDKPHIVGSNLSWRARHIVFTQSYNQSVETPWRLSQWDVPKLRQLLH